MNLRNIILYLKKILRNLWSIKFVYGTYMTQGIFEKSKKNYEFLPFLVSPLVSPFFSYWTYFFHKKPMWNIWDIINIMGNVLIIIINILYIIINVLNIRNIAKRSYKLLKKITKFWKNPHEWLLIYIIVLDDQLKNGLITLLVNDIRNAWTIET